MPCAKTLAEHLLCFEKMSDVCGREVRNRIQRRSSSHIMLNKKLKVVGLLYQQPFHFFMTITD